MKQSPHYRRLSSDISFVILIPEATSSCCVFGRASALACDWPSGETTPPGDVPGRYRLPVVFVYCFFFFALPFVARPPCHERADDKMASSASSGDDVRKELTCAICLDFFKDPVILKCGHNFCRFCICMHWDENGGDYGYQCPQCRTVNVFWGLGFLLFFFLACCCCCCCCSAGAALW